MKTLLEEDEMKRVFPISIGIIFICFLMILSCTPSGQKSADPYLTGNKSTAEEAEKIKIGLVGPFSGIFKYVALYYYEKIEFAVQEQNAKGGLLGRKIEIIREDSELRADVAARKAEKLIIEKNVTFITAIEGSHATIALNRAATQYRTIFINSIGSADRIQGKEFSRYAFSIGANNYTQTTTLTRLMATKPFRKYYIVSPDYDYGHDLANAFKKQIKKHIPDARIVGEDYHLLGTRNFNFYIDNVKAAGADAVFSGSFASDLGQLVRQSRRQGLKAPFPFVTPGGPILGEFARKEDGAGIYTTAGYSMMVDTPENKAWIAKYQRRHKFDSMWKKWPATDAGATILGWQMFFAAVEKAGSFDPEKIIAAFEGFRYKTPVGWWHMRKCDHQVMLPMFGMVTKAGQNPYFPFPWYGPDIVQFSAEETAIPATRDHNPRCP
jgi:branched-chain amino acid transport system substrate-binding protein